MGKKKWPQSRKCLTFYPASPQLCPFGEDEKESRVVGREGKETEQRKSSVQREEESRWEEVQSKKKKKAKKWKIRKRGAGAEPRRTGRGVGQSEEVTFGDQRLFVVTFSHLCSSLMPEQCALAHLSLLS